MLLSLSMRLRTTAVMGSDSVQLILKPLCESRAGLVYLMRVRIHGNDGTMTQVESVIIGLGWPNWEDNTSYAAYERDGLGSKELMQPTRVQGMTMSNEIQELRPKV